MNSIFVSWKTSVCGLIAAVMVAWQAYDFSNFNWKTFLMAAAIAAFGFVSRDSNKSSEETGAK